MALSEDAAEEDCGVNGCSVEVGRSGSDCGNARKLKVSRKKRMLKERKLNTVNSGRCCHALLKERFDFVLCDLSRGDAEKQLNDFSVGEIEFGVAD